MGNNFPLLWIRKELYATAESMDERYFKFIGEGDKKEKLALIHDPGIPYMDDVYLRQACNVDYHGTPMDAFIFAAAFQVQVVMYSTTLKMKEMYYYDGRQYNSELECCLGAFKGLHHKKCSLEQRF